MGEEKAYKKAQGHRKATPLNKEFKTVTKKGLRRAKTLEKSYGAGVRRL